MKVLIIDRDELNSQLLATKIKGLGHRVQIETIKNNAIDHLSRENFDVVFVDPNPLTNARPLILNIRRALGAYAYIVLVKDIDVDVDFANSGANFIIDKPYDAEIVANTLAGAGRITTYLSKLGDDSIDFPSAGGVIAKSAFNQLFLSAIDRADRHNESSYAVFIDISNYLDMSENDGQYYADFAVAKMSQHLSHIRRQSDIIGQTAKNEYALLLQRPQYETEPVDAANRFAEELSKLKSIKESVESDPQIKVKLIELPSGKKVVDHHIILKA